MKKTNLSWVGALLVFALLLWCTAATPGKIADPSTYTCAVYSSALSLLPPVVAIVLALNTKEVYTSLLVGIATGALLYANGNLELALTTLFFNLMDVREEERYKEGHLENAISCPYGILKECYEQMDGKKIIVYCDFGGQSMMAARHLRKDGFEVYNIIGGVYYYMKEKEQNKSEA